MFQGKMKAITFSYDDGVTQDIRLADGLYYVPADNLTELTGLTFTADEAAKMLTVALPVAE